MTARTVHLGFEVGLAAAVEIPIRHMAVTGQTQESGKTTTLEALISRSGLAAIAFLTKRGEKSFTTGRRIRPFFKERADWQFVQSIIESVMRQDQKFKQPWIMRACEGAKSLADVQRRCAKLEAEAKHAMSQDMYMVLGAYLEKVVPLIASLPKAGKVDLLPGLNVMDLTDYPLELQMLVISSTLQWIHDHAEGVISIVPEAWEFVPQGKNTPVKLSAEKLARKGAALGNYLWIDSQDLAAVDKTILRSCAVVLFGVQREANELKRSLSNMPAGLKKPKAEDVATLELGQFFACYGKEIRKTYVQPAWMEEEIAREIAAGRLNVNEVPGKAVARQIEDRYSTEEKGLPDRADLARAGRYVGPIVAGAFPLGSRSEGSGDGSPSLQTSAHVHTRQCWDDPGPGHGPPFLVCGFPKDARESEEVMEKISARDLKAALAEHGFSDEAIERLFASKIEDQYREQLNVQPLQPLNGNHESIVAAVLAQIRRDPVLIRLSQESPAIEVKVNRANVSVDDSTIKGKIALLIHAGWWQQPRSFTDAKSEMIRRGLDPKTPNVRISAALADFVQMGFFWRTEGNGFELAPGAQSRVVER